MRVPGWTRVQDRHRHWRPLSPNRLHGFSTRYVKERSGGHCGPKLARGGPEMESWWKAKGYIVIHGLAVLAILQIMMLTLARAGPATGGPVVESGYDFGAVEVVGADSIVGTLATGQPTLVLVFHSACAYCAVVAPEWAEWLRKRTPVIGVLAVSREPHAAALGYARSHGWNVDVRSVLIPPIGGSARALIRLTPWIYALDAEGTVVAAGHGSELERVAADLRSRVKP